MEALHGRLRENGVRPDRVAFYRTVGAPEAAEAARRLVQSTVDAVVFASPSALRFLRLAGEERSLHAALSACRRIAIGPVTAAALAHDGLPATAVAEHPTDDAVVAAVVAALRPADRSSAREP
jgi:uroporphyrinogen-III synthase